MISPAEVVRTVAEVFVETCSECGAVLAPEQLDAHLRDQHQLYRFRGNLAAAGAMLPAVVAALARGEIDAYPLLELLARDQHGRRAGAFLATSLGAAIASADGPQRAALCDALAGVLAGRHGAGAWRGISPPSRMRRRDSSR